MVGLEEQIEREDGSEERRESKRTRMETTREAVCEALGLWSNKADYLQVRDTVVKLRFCMAADLYLGPGTPALAHNAHRIVFGGIHSSETATPSLVWLAMENSMLPPESSPVSADHHDPTELLLQPSVQSRGCADLPSSLPPTAAKLLPAS